MKFRHVLNLLIRGYSRLRAPERLDICWFLTQISASEKFSQGENLPHQPDRVGEEKGEEGLA